MTTTFRSSDCVIFDVDGTLTDPREGITGSLSHALKIVGGLSVPPEELIWCIGPPLQECLLSLLGDVDLAARALEVYRDRYTAGGLFEATVYEGIPEALSDLRAVGLRLMVATSKPRPFALRVLEYFDLLGQFEAVYGANLDGRWSRKGTLLCRLIQERAVNPSRAVMVGDRRHDAEGAREAGLHCILVSYGYGGPDELAGAKPDMVCRRPAGLLEAVATLLRVNV